MEPTGISIAGGSLQQQSRVAESVDSGRKKMDEGQSDAASVSTAESSKVAPEEILGKIKSLTEDGLYSVRFENSQEFERMIVKVVNRETNEVIRQVPAEEILGMQAGLEELRGNLFDGTG